MRPLKNRFLATLVAVAITSSFPVTASAAGTLVFRQPLQNLVVTTDGSGSGGETPPTQPPAQAQAQVAVAPAALTFDSLKLNATSPEQVVTVTNSGNAAATLSSITATGPFNVGSTTCGSTLAAGASCTVNVSFTPVTAGGATGSLSVPASSGANSVSLAGTGQAAQGIVVSGNTRTWLDGSLATSCNMYRNGDGLAAHTYTGATGDGVYRLQLSVPTDVFCDMTKDGGGWTLVMNAVSPQIGGWAGATGSLNPAGLATQATTAKLADTDIRTLTVTGLRLTSANYGGITRYVKPTCRYGHTTSVYQTPCGTTYSNLSWANAVTSDDNRGLTFGVSDAMLHTGWYFLTSDIRGYAWFVADGGVNYGGGNGFQTATSLQMWAK